MNDTFHCDDKDQLVAYLYDELDAGARRAVDDHLRVCGACASEVRGLRGVRQELAGWAAPDLALDLETPPVSAPAQVLRPARWAVPAAIPGWARVAAAVVAAAAGLGLANLQVRYDANGLLVTTGWMSPSTAPAVAPAPDADAWRPALAALESSLRRELAEQAARSTPAVETAASSDVDLRRVNQLIEQSERRQRRELALRLTQFNRDLEVQRRADLVRINQGFGQFEGRAGAEIQRQRQMLDYIMRVSAQPPPQ